MVSDTKRPEGEYRASVAREVLPPVPPGVDVGSIEDAASQRTMRGRYDDHRVLYVRSDALARGLFGVVAVLTVIGTVRWGFEANARFDSDRAGWFRWIQLAWAVAGIVAAIPAITYSTYYAATGRTWRRWMPVMLVFGLLAGSWTILWWTDYLIARVRR